MLYRKHVEAIVASLMPIVLKRKRDMNGYELYENYVAGAMAVAAAMLNRPGVSAKAMQKKVSSAFRGVHEDFVHTKLAEEKIVEDLLA